jgi:hypothetical protein
MTEIEVAALCDVVCERLKASGFNQVYQSMQSEARYFQLKGFPGVLRVAYHRQKKSSRTINGDHVVAKITFSRKAPKYTEKSVEQMMRFAVGAYVLNKNLTKPNGRETP